MAPFVAVLLAFSVGRARRPDGGAGLVRCIRRPSGARAVRARAPGARSAPGRSAARSWCCRSAVLVLALAGAANLQRCWDYTIALARAARPAGRGVQGGRGRRRRSSVCSRTSGTSSLAAVALAARVPRAARAGPVAAAAHAAGPVAHGDDELAARGRRGDRLRARGAVSVPVRPGRAQGGRRPAAPVGVGAGAAGRGDDRVHERRRLRPRRRRAAARAWWRAASSSPGDSRRCGERRGASWPAVAGLAAVVLVTLAFQFQFQYGGAGWRDLSARDGLRSVAGHRRHSRSSAPVWTASPRTSRAEARPGDELLIYPQGAALLPVLAGRDRRQHVPALRRRRRGRRCRRRP